MSVLSKFNTAIDDAVKKGVISRTRQGPMISAARKIAKLMDDPDWPIIKGKVDNVTPSVFLKYCLELHLGPDVAAGKKDMKTELTVVGKSKWKKQV